MPWRTQHSWSRKSRKRFLFVSFYATTIDTHTLVCSVIKTSNERSYRILSVIPWTSGPKEETGVRAHARGGLKMQQCPLWFTLTATLSMSLMHSSRQEQPNLFFCPLSHSGGKKDVIVTTDKCLKHLNGASSGQRNI